MTNTLKLAGCRLDPLASYLKSIGVLRIVHQQLDNDVRGWFSAGEFCLRTLVDEQNLIRFFAEQYSPSPVVSPWSGGSGFYPKDNQTYISAIENSKDPRLDTYRETIEKAKDILSRQDSTTAPKDSGKPALLRACRAALPDEAIPWLDVAYALTESSVSYFPLFVSGGNDGRLEFSLNFMRHITELLLTQGGDSASRQRLASALFATEDAPLVKSAIGMFSPGGAGGANAAAGFFGDSLVNPWDFVLMIEGSLAFAGAVARRLGEAQASRGVFPFTVMPTTVGPAALSDDDSSGSQAAEIWFPIWERPASFQEIGHVLSEGRAQSGREQARRGVDFAMAVAQLGVDRGINSFQRYAFYVRNGLAHLAIPLENVEVAERPSVSLITEVKPFIDSLRSKATDKGPARFRSLIRRIDHAVLDFCKLGGERRLQRVLASLGAAERCLATSATDGIRERVKPLHNLHPRWLIAAYDGTPEYRLAASLGSIGATEAHPWPIRCQMEPVKVTGQTVIWSRGSASFRYSASSSVYRVMLAVLVRRVVLAAKHQAPFAPMQGILPANLQDIDLFIRGEINQEKLVDLLWSMMSVRWQAFSPARDWPTTPRRVPAELSRLYALLKTAYCQMPIYLPGMSEPLRVRLEPEILTRLHGGDAAGAALAAIRRLHRSGLTAAITQREFADLTTPFPCSAAQATRIGAALLFSVRPDDQRELCNMVLAHNVVSPLPQ